MLRPPRVLPHSVTARNVALLFLALITSTGCDALFGIGNDDIRGFWTRSHRGSTVYLHIDESKLGVHTERGTCFQGVELHLGFRGGGTYTLRSDLHGPPTYIGIRRAGKRLRVGDPATPVKEWTRWDPARGDPAGLTKCPPGGGADSSITCSALQKIKLPHVVRGHLSSGDPVAWEGGPYYHLYRLDVDRTRQVQIELQSDSLYTLLLLYDAGGDLIAESENNQTSFNSLGLTDAALRMTLDPGCYRIEATTVRSGETGSYFLRVF